MVREIATAQQAEAQCSLCPCRVVDGDHRDASDGRDLTESIFLQRIGVRCVTDMMHLGCALPSSACSHHCSRAARLDGQCIPPLDSDCNGGVDCVGERMVGGEGEVVLGCEAELVDELLRGYAAMCTLGYPFCGTLGYGYR